MRKKILFLTLFCVINTLLFSGFVQQDVLAAQEETKGNKAVSKLDVSEKHYYQVLMDRQGTANIFVKIKLHNNSEFPLSKLDIEIAGTKHRILNIVQEDMAQKKTCVSYEDVCVEKSQVKCLKTDKKCSSWEVAEDIDTLPSYKNIDYTYTIKPFSVVYNLSFPNHIAPQGSSSVLLYYQSRDYVKKRLDLYKFRFLTIGSTNRIESARVNISVGQDLYLKYGKQNNSYIQLFPSFFQRSENYDDKKQVGMRVVSAFIETIDGYSTVYKNIPAGQSLYIDGEYGASILVLYREIIVLIVLLFALAIFVLLNLIRIFDFLSKKKK